MQCRSVNSHGFDGRTGLPCTRCPIVQELSAETSAAGHCLDGSGLVIHYDQDVYKRQCLYLSAKRIKSADVKSIGKQEVPMDKSSRAAETVSYTHLDVYKRQK